jgi:hypothetical protein
VIQPIKGNRSKRLFGLTDPLVKGEKIAQFGLNETGLITLTPSHSPGDYSDFPGAIPFQRVTLLPLFLILQIIYDVMERKKGRGRLSWSPLRHSKGGKNDER